jgi:hypothetical protein
MFEDTKVGHVMHLIFENATLIEPETASEEM